MGIPSTVDLASYGNTPAPLGAAVAIPAQAVPEAAAEAAPFTPATASATAAFPSPQPT